MWKTFAGHCIYTSPNGAKVHQNYMYRWLTLGGDALHTLINRRHPEKPELGYIHQLGFAVREQPADCCLLGLGGAGIVHALAPYLKRSNILAVENNADIIEIANVYFKADSCKNLSVIYQDADRFVKDCEARYQHLIIDLFDSHSFPATCNTYDFFAHCHRMLLPDGILAVNLTHLQEQWPVFKHIRENFSERTVLLPVKGAANVVVLACKSPSVAPLLDILKTSRRLKELSWDALWGCVAYTC